MPIFTSGTSASAKLQFESVDKKLIELNAFVPLTSVCVPASDTVQNHKLQYKSPGTDL